MPGTIQIEPAPFATSIDGRWCPFPLEIGNSPVYVLVSNTQSIDYVIEQEACESASGGSNTSLCQSRGGVYDPYSSSTFHQFGIDSLQLASQVETNSKQIALYGTDTVQVGIQGTGGPSLPNSLVAAIEDQTYWYGYFGILPTPFSFSNGSSFSTTLQTYFQTLRNQNLISSLSWGYTAGSPYQNGGNGPVGSLIFGGYDANRFVSNNLIFPMMTGPGSNNNNYLSLELSAMSANTSNGQTNFLSNSITVQLDSTLPYLWFSPDVCTAIASTFNLDYNEALNMYFANNSVYNQLSNENPMFTLTFSDSQGQTANITMPYGAFDLQSMPPLTNTTMNYFPIKQTNSSNFVLGRAFFQEAYVVANFHNYTFSIGQQQSPLNYKSDIITIYDNVTTTSVPSKSGGSSDAGAIAGGVVGGILGAAIIIFLAWFCLLRPGKGLRKHQQREERDHPDAAELSGHARDPQSEKDREDLSRRARSPGQDNVPPYTANELDASKPQELLGSMPPELSAMRDEAEHPADAGAIEQHDTEEAVKPKEENEGAAAS